MQPTCERPECIIEYKNIQQKKDWAVEKKERLDKLKTYSDWKSDLEDLMREIVRLIDKGNDCISCGAKTTKINPAQAGHRWAKGSYDTIRFHLLNMWVQGSCCNKHKSGNLDGYDDAILRIYGRGVLDYIKYDLRQIQALKLSIPEIKEKIEIAKQIIKELKAVNLENLGYKVRLELRKEYNSRLGIYDEIKLI